MHKISWLTSNNAQNPTRNFQKCKNIPRGSSNNAQNLITNFQNSQNHIRNFLKSYEELQKLHHILWVSSNNANNHMKNFQNTKHPIRNFQKCTRCFWHICLVLSVNCVHILAWGEINDFCRLAENRIIITYGCVHELRICS